MLGLIRRRLEGIATPPGSGLEIKGQSLKGELEHLMSPEASPITPTSPQMRLPSIHARLHRLLLERVSEGNIASRTP